MNNPLASLFPFNLLMFWLRPYEAQGERCALCQEKASYTLESYVAVPASQSQADLDASWMKSLEDQLAGVYTKTFTKLYCEKCTYHFIDMSSGGQAATLSMTLSGVVGDALSLILGCTLEHQDDLGKNFVAHYYGNNSIEDLARKLKRNEGVHVHLNKREK